VHRGIQCDKKGGLGGGGAWRGVWCGLRHTACKKDSVGIAIMGRTSGKFGVELIVEVVSKAREEE